MLKVVLRQPIADATTDARGFRHWNEAGRSKAFSILGPIRKKVENWKKKQGVQLEEVEAANEDGFVGILLAPILAPIGNCREGRKKRNLSSQIFPGLDSIVVDCQRGTPLNLKNRAVS